jgi:hypothetical protein
MLGPLSLGDLLVIYSVILVIYIVLTEFELIKFRKARMKFIKMFGAEENQLRAEESVLLKEIKEIRQIVNQFSGKNAQATTQPATQQPQTPAKST